jgi:hypothetical protein
MVFAGSISPNRSVVCKNKRSVDTERSPTAAADCVDFGAQHSYGLNGYLQKQPLYVRILMRVRACASLTGNPIFESDVQSNPVNNGTFATAKGASARELVLLARTALQKGDFEGALRHQKAAYELNMGERGARDPATMKCMELTVATLMRMGNFAEAEPLVKELMRLCRSELGDVSAFASL